MARLSVKTAHKQLQVMDGSGSEGERETENHLEWGEKIMGLSAVIKLNHITARPEKHIIISLLFFLSSSKQGTALNPTP